jgi:SEC-C motif-containing protein
MAAKAKPGAPCPCGARRTYGECCGRLHAGEAAPDAQALMRSRYTAYVFGIEDYLLDTWHPATRPAELRLAESSPRWLGLQVRRTAATGADQAVVEFVARYKAGGRSQTLHEVSRFVREDGRWFYLDGDVESE